MEENRDGQTRKTGACNHRRQASALRYGGGIKQLEPVGANGEIIMDYSIHDALAAGFRKIIFVIRHDIRTGYIVKLSETELKKKLLIWVVYLPL
jgi:hypothetical protein